MVAEQVPFQPHRRLILDSSTKPRARFGVSQCNKQHLTRRKLFPRPHFQLRHMKENTVCGIVPCEQKSWALCDAEHKAWYWFVVCMQSSSTRLKYQHIESNTECKVNLCTYMFFTHFGFVYRRAKRQNGGSQRLYEVMMASIHIMLGPFCFLFTEKTNKSH